jgi:voltage-gated potassium channel
MSTVGYQEVKPLSEPGMWFTLSLIVTSLGIFAFTITLISRRFVEVVILNLNKNKKVEKRIGQIKQHVIVVGYGRNGQQAVEELRSRQIPTVIIESKPVNVQRLAVIPDILYIQGDATEDKVLIEAGIERARALITALPNDADNLFVVVTARELNPGLKIVSRASSVGNDKKLKLAGASNVIMPDTVGGQRMATLIVQPDILEFVENIMLTRSGDVSLVELSCSAISNRNEEITIESLRVREMSGVTILGLKNSNNQYTLNPAPDSILTPDDMLFVLGTTEQVDRLKDLLRK